jgi:transcriptional regulator EpsA
MGREAEVIDVLRMATSVNSKDDFMRLIDESVQRVLPHEIMICGIGAIRPFGSFVHRYLNRGYPLGYYHSMKDAEGRVDSPLMQRWRQTLKPVVFQSGRDDADYPDAWVALVKKFDLRNLIGHGVLDMKGPCSSYFIFSRLANEIGAEEAETLSLITPHLHSAMVRIEMELEQQAGCPQFVQPLTARQLEILGWINNGKSNWEIARIVDTTQANVKYHVEQIYQKLGVSTRVQAVACAKDLGILPRRRDPA